MFKGLGAGAPDVVYLTVSSDTNNYNLYDAASHPALPVIVVCTVNSGVTVGHTAGLAAFRTGGRFATGSVLRLINNGRITGRGGDGGAGGSSPGVGSGNPGSAGSDGSTAIYLDDNLTVDNGGG